MLVRRSYPGGRVERVPVQPYVARDPGAAPLPKGLPARPTLLDQDDLIEDAGPGYDVIHETGQPRAETAPSPAPPARGPRPPR